MATAARVQKTYSNERNSTEAANQNRPPLRVIKGSDRSFLNDRTRGAQVTSKNTAANRDLGHGDTASNFNASYAKKGLQPRGLVDESGEADNRRRYQQPEQITRAAQTGYAQKAPKQKLSPITRKRFLAKNKYIRKARGTIKATSINIWTWTWGIYLWAVFQLPMALASAAFFGISEAIHDYYTTNIGPDAQTATIGGTVFQIVGEFAISTSMLINEISKFLFNIDLSILNPANFFGVTYLMVLLFGWFFLGLVYFLYAIGRVNSLSGKGAVSKWSLFVLAVIGYGIPIANIFPWFIFWTMAVWKNPK